MSHSILELMRPLKKEWKIELAVQELEKLEKEMKILKEILEEDLNIRKCDYCSEWKHNVCSTQYILPCMCEDCYLEKNGKKI